MTTLTNPIPAFKTERGTWKLSATESTGWSTCIDTYRLVGTKEFQSIDRAKLGRMIKNGKYEPVMDYRINM